MLINNLPIILIQYLLLTTVIETVIAIIIGIRHKKDILNVILVNVVTNPLLNALQIYIGFKHGENARNIAIIVLEMMAFLVEGFIYYRFLENKKYNGFLLSFILNCSSYFIGEVINMYGTKSI